MNPDNQQKETVDTADVELATAARLRRLSTFPVDLTNVQRHIHAEIRRPPSRSQGLSWRIRPLAALAASLLVVVMGASVVLLTLPSRVLASPQVMQQLYESGTANDMHMAPGETMACCVQKVEGKSVTCVMLDVNGKRVSMVVGDAAHFRVPDEAGRRTVNGIEYRYQSSNRLNMVMAVKDGAWVCLMGEASIDDLIALMGQTPLKK